MRREPGTRPGSRAGSAGEFPLVLAEYDDSVDDPDAEEEDPQLPERVMVAHGEQGSNRPEAAADDADEAAPGITGHQREPTGELDHPEDDQHPTHRVEIREDVPGVVHVEIRIGNRPDAVNDVERSHHQQQDRHEYRSTCSSHVGLLSVAGRPWATVSAGPSFDRANEDLTRPSGGTPDLSLQAALSLRSCS